VAMDQGDRHLVSCGSPQVCGVCKRTRASRLAGAAQAIDRRERLRRLALETIDLSKDPYFMRNHLGQYECRLCLTLHNNEGNYLAHTQARQTHFLPAGSAALQGISLAHTQALRRAEHASCLLAAQQCRTSAWRTPRRAGAPSARPARWQRSSAGLQWRAPRATALGGARSVSKDLRRPGGAQGKRHQQNLAKRAAREAADKPAQPAPNRRASVRKVVNIGRPGYRVTKQYDPETDQRSLLFQARPRLTWVEGDPREHRAAAGCFAAPGLCLAARRSLPQRTGDPCKQRRQALGKRRPAPRRREPALCARRLAAGRPRVKAARLCASSRSAGVWCTCTAGSGQEADRTSGAGRYLAGPLPRARLTLLPARHAQVEYPEIEEGAKPRHRFMSAYEQKKEAWDKSYQYLLFAADPYEVIAFKIPNLEVDRSDRFFSHWRAPAHPLTLQWTLHGTLHGTLFSHWRARLTRSPCMGSCMGLCMGLCMGPGMTACDVHAVPGRALSARTRTCARRGADPRGACGWLGSPLSRAQRPAHACSGGQPAGA